MVKLFRKESKVEKHAQNHVEIVFNSVLKLKEVMSCFYACEL